MSGKSLSYEDFDGFNNSTIDKLLSISTFVLDLSATTSKYRFILACVGLNINIFHILVLSQKSMRNNCINVIMMGIGVFDLLNLSYDVYANLRTLTRDQCSSPPSSYFFLMLDLWIPAISDNARRLITWLAFLMVFLRFLILKNSLNPKFDRFSSPRFVLKIMIIGFIVSTFMSVFFFGRFSFKESEWEAPKTCNITEKFIEYNRIISYDFLQYDAPLIRFFNIIDGLMKLIPTCLFPVLTYLLIKQLRDAENSRRKIARKQDDSKKDHTTKLVIMMTITFIAAEGPFGLVFFFQGLVIYPSGLSDMAADLLELFEFFVVINAVSHCFVCLFVSSPYRRAVKEMFCRNRKISVTVNEKQLKSKASVVSVSTVRRVAVKT